jgi:hypothetical protein
MVVSQLRSLACFVFFWVGTRALDVSSSGVVSSSGSCVLSSSSGVLSVVQRGCQEFCKGFACAKRFAKSFAQQPQELCKSYQEFYRESFPRVLQESCKSFTERFAKSFAKVLQRFAKSFTKSFAQCSARGWIDGWMDRFGVVRIVLQEFCNSFTTVSQQFSQTKRLGLGSRIWGSNGARVADVRVAGVVAYLCCSCFFGRFSVPMRLTCVRFRELCFVFFVRFEACGLFRPVTGCVLCGSRTQFSKVYKSFTRVSQECTNSFTAAVSQRVLLQELLVGVQREFYKTFARDSQEICKLF